MTQGHFPTVARARRLIRWCAKPRRLIIIAVVALAGWFFAPHAVFHCSVIQMRFKLNPQGTISPFPERQIEMMRWAADRRASLRLSLLDLHRDERGNSVGRWALWVYLGTSDDENDKATAAALLMEDYSPEAVAEMTATEHQFLINNLSTWIHMVDGISTTQISDLVTQAMATFPALVRIQSYLPDYIIPEGAISPSVTLSVPERPVDMVLSPDGMELVCIFSDDTCQVWDLTTGEMVREFESSGAGRIAMSPAGDVVALSQWSGVEIRDLSTGAILGTNSQPQSANGDSMFSPDGEWLMSWEDGIRVWDIEGDQNLFEWEETSGSVTGLDLSDDKSSIAFGTREGEIAVLDLETGGAMQLCLPGLSSVKGVAFSPASSELVAFHYFDLSCWSLESGALIRRSPLISIMADELVPLPSGTHGIISMGSTIRIVRLDTGAEEACFIAPGTSSAHLTACWESTRFAVSGAYTGSIAIYDIPSHTQVMEEGTSEE